MAAMLVMNMRLLRGCFGMRMSMIMLMGVTMPVIVMRVMMIRMIVFGLRSRMRMFVCASAKTKRGEQSPALAQDQPGAEERDACITC